MLTDSSRDQKNLCGGGKAAMAPPSCSTATTRLAVRNATGLIAGPAAIIVAVPTSKTCTMCGGLPARQAAIAPVMVST